MKPKHKVPQEGTQYGRWTVIEEGKLRHGRYRMMLCECNCGRRKEVYYLHLLKGISRSCGCLSAELAATRNATHGHCRHGRLSPEYTSYMRMKDRCYNPRNKDYAIYGGRGITVCDRWRNSFRAFLEDVGPRPSRQHTLDRDDNDGDYMPGHVHWGTKKQQARNRRNNRIIVVRGVEKCLAEWAEVLGIKYNNLYMRIHRAKHRAAEVVQKLVDSQLAAHTKVA